MTAVKHSESDVGIGVSVLYGVVRNDDLILAGYGDYARVGLHTVSSRITYKREYYLL
jgi:hypothetical protein